MAVWMVNLYELWPLADLEWAVCQETSDEHHATTDDRCFSEFDEYLWEDAELEWLSSIKSTLWNSLDIHHTGQ